MDSHLKAIQALNINQDGVIDEEEIEHAAVILQWEKKMIMYFKYGVSGLIILVILLIGCTLGSILIAHKMTKEIYIEDDNSLTNDQGDSRLSTLHFILKVHNSNG